MPTVQPVIRPWDVFTAEMIKIVTHPATTLMLVLTASANMFLAAVDASNFVFVTGSAEPSRLSSFGIVMLAPIYPFLVLPIYAAASEYHGGQVRVSLVVTPRRSTFILAKVLAMLTVVVPAATIALIPARLIAGFSNSLTMGQFFDDLGRWSAVYILMSVIAFGLAGALRNAIAPLGILIALPVVLATGILQWPDGVKFLPDQASLSLLRTPGYEVTELPAATAALTLTGWALGLIAVYTITFARRDA